MTSRRVPERWWHWLLPVELLLLSALAVWKVPFSYPEGDIALNALAVLRTGHVQSTFLPALYPYVIAHLYRWGGPAGFILLQISLYAGLVLLMQRVMDLGTLRGRASLVAAALLALDPDLVAAIPKAMDTLLTSALLVLVVSLCMRAKRQPGRPAWAQGWALGCTWGLALAVRPNLALLVLPIAYALWRRNRWQAALRCCVAALIAFVVLAAANTIAHGSFYLPHNGPYNFFAGANRFSASALLHGYNAELSIPAAFAGNWPAGVARPVASHDYYNARLNPLYTHLAICFVTAHPLQWLWLGVLKLFTLLRPSLRNHAALSGSGLVEIATTLCTPAWLLLLVISRRVQGGLTCGELQLDRLFLTTIGAYLLPFLLTNADPRFRTPLDVLVMTHAAILVLRTRWTRHENGAAAAFSRRGEGRSAVSPAAPAQRFGSQPCAGHTR